MTIPMDEAKDRVLGAEGTPRREAYEQELSQELEAAVRQLTGMNLVWKNPDLAFQITQKYERSNCAHKHAELDMTARVVICWDCKLQIDPFDFLLEISGEESYHARLIKSLKAEKKTLERQVRNLKNRLKP